MIQKEVVQLIGTYNIFGLDASYIIPSAGFNSPLANTMRFSLSVNFDQPKGNKKRSRRA